MLNPSYAPSIDEETIDKLLNKLDAANTFSKITHAETYGARGVNIDYLLVLKSIKGNIVLEKLRIEKHFSEVFARVVQILKSDEIYSSKILNEYIKNCGLIDVSAKLYEVTKNETLNYCIKLDSRFLPDIPTLINPKLTSLDQKLTLAERQYKAGIYKQQKLQNPHLSDLTEENIYQQVIANLNKEFANYILIWLHAYRLSTAIHQCRTQEGIIAFSHRYKGWNLPEYQVNNNFKLNFKTNFGYGRSSYFYVLLNYKDVQIFPFTDWVDYEYIQASELVKHSEIIHEWHFVSGKFKSDGKSISYCKPEVIIKNEFWQTAMHYVVKAANMAINNEEAFIKNYILDPIEELIYELSLLLSADNSAIALKYPKFEKNFKLERANKEGDVLFKDLYIADIRAEKVSGTLQFISEFIKLSDVISNSEMYVQKIESLNQQILPLIKTYLEKSEKLTVELFNSIQELRTEISYIYNGSDNSPGLKEILQNKVNLSLQTFEKSYPNFQVTNEKYKKLLKKKDELEKEYNFVNLLKNNFSRYLKNIDNYFSSISNSQTA